MCEECGWKVTLEDIEAALADVPDLPDRAEEFANSVDEKLRSIHEWVTEHDHITDAQQDAVANMISGVDKWLA
jgi:hypothetical protein